jgi:hypothetical protein
MIAWFLWASAATSDPAAVAVQLEEAAFTAIEQKDWCTAMNLFIEADAASPTVEYIYNAARAAENGGDLVKALALYQGLVGTARAKDAKPRVNALQKRLKTEPGAPCPSPQPKVVEPDPPPPPPDVPPAPPPPAPVVEPGPSGSAIGGLVLMASGVVVTGAGVGAAVFGIVPLQRFDTAQLALRKAADGGEVDPETLAGLQAEQAQARQQWEGFGRPLLIAGIVGVGVGVAAIASGGALWALSE